MGWDLTHIIFPLQIRRILLRRPFYLIQQRLEIMLRVLIVLHIRQWRRLCDVDCCAGDVVRLRFGSGRVGRLGMDAFTGDGRKVEAPAKSWLGLLRNLRVDGSWCCDPADAEGWADGGEDCSGGPGEHTELIKNGYWEGFVGEIE